MKKKLIALLCLIAFACVMFCACSSSNESEETKTITINASSDDSKNQESASEADSEETLESASDSASNPESESKYVLPGLVDPSTGQPFWGVWIGGFPDQESANSFEAEARSRGLAAGQTVSSNWSNLNPTTYYVVYAGAFANQADAEGDLGMIRNMGYPDAYIKYSGDYIG